jgi:hypothetical protein
LCFTLPRKSQPCREDKLGAPSHESASSHGRAGLRGIDLSGRQALLRIAVLVYVRRFKINSGSALAAGPETFVFSYRVRKVK